MPRLWVTSDTHFNHVNLWNSFPMERREWSNSPGHMDEVMISRWNRLVGPDDVVLHLGDFVFGAVQLVSEIRARLAGKLWLVVGNHDRTPTAMRRLLQPSDLAFRRLQLSVRGVPVVCRHKPQHFTDADKLSDAVQWWHGHLHDRVAVIEPPFRLFGVDVHGPDPQEICDLSEVERTP